MNPQVTDPNLRPLTIPEMLLERARKAPAAPLFRCGEIRRDSRMMADAAARAGGLLRSAGIEAGQTGALLAPNRKGVLDLIPGPGWSNSGPDVLQQDRAAGLHPGLRMDRRRRCPREHGEQGRTVAARPDQLPAGTDG